MNDLVMIDTSVWAHALRQHGDPVIRARVRTLLDEQRAAWCEIIRLELWAGVRGNDERFALNELDTTLPRIPITHEVWEQAVAYASRGRAAGFTVPAGDLLIFACAKRYNLPIERQDYHFDLLERL
jgi:predicted nucleic acid-binding protein